MDKNAKLLLTMAGIGIIGMLSGCGTSQPLDPVSSVPLITPEPIEKPIIVEESVSGNEAASVSPTAPSASDGKTTNTNKLENEIVLNSDFTDRKVTEEFNSSEPDPEPVSGQEIFALTDNREEADKIADLYGIELISFDLGVAIYTTDQDVDELIQMGIDNGYPELSVNRKLQPLQ